MTIDDEDEDDDDMLWEFKYYVRRILCEKYYVRRILCEKYYVRRRRTRGIRTAVEVGSSILFCHMRRAR